MPDIDIYSLISSAIKSTGYDLYPNDGVKFIAWYLRNVYEIDELEVQDCIVDGANDKQIDAILIDDSEQIIYIIQGKFTTTDKQLTGSVVREMRQQWASINSLESLQLQGNTKISSKVPEIRAALDKDYDVCLRLVTTTTLTQEAMRDFKSLQTEIESSEVISASLELVDNPALCTNYMESQNAESGLIDFTFHVDPDKCLRMTDIGDAEIVVAAIPLTECIKITGIHDQRLFSRNVRLWLGKKKKINKDIVKTIQEESRNFIYYHNGVTAICRKCELNEGFLIVEQMSIVNGCQSLNAIYNCSETVNHAEQGFILFRFIVLNKDNNHEEMVNKISTRTNSQTTVKPRDLRSNDKTLLDMKKRYKSMYSKGDIILKNGEKELKKAKLQSKIDPQFIVDSAELAKQIVTWHLQKPTLTDNENKLFESYFELIFRKDYQPPYIYYLNRLYKNIEIKWKPKNPAKIDKDLLRIKTMGTYYHLFIISQIFCKICNQLDKVPSPVAIGYLFDDNQLEETVINLAAKILSSAFQKKKRYYDERHEVFSPKKWLQSNEAINDIKNQTSDIIDAYTLSVSGNLEEQLQLDPSDFEEKWSTEL